MTYDEKKLLMKDLCSRLPYGVKCYAYQYKIDGNDCECSGTLTGIKDEYFYLSDRVSINGGKTYDERYREVKPYLRPMSSMTDEERTKIASMAGHFNDLTKAIEVCFACLTIVDYCYSRHLDIHGLIEKGLAFETPEDIY